jgi:hypothetical protein
MFPGSPDTTMSEGYGFAGAPDVEPVPVAGIVMVAGFENEKTQPGDGLGDGVGDALGDGLGLGVGVGDADGDGLGVGDAVGVGVGVGDGPDGQPIWTVSMPM